MTVVSETPIMGTTPARASAYPEHAQVLALLSAYTAVYGNPAPWLELVSIVERLVEKDSPAAPHLAPLQRTADALADLVTDLRRLDLIQSGPAGSALTENGEAVAATWNGHFARRRERAIEAIRDL